MALFIILGAFIANTGLLFCFGSFHLYCLSDAFYFFVSLVIIQDLNLSVLKDLTWPCLTSVLPLFLPPLLLAGHSLKKKLKPTWLP